VQIHPKSKEIQAVRTKSRRKNKSDYFSWTDDEVELLLNVAIDYKMTKTMENINCE